VKEGKMDEMVTKDAREYILWLETKLEQRDRALRMAPEDLFPHGVGANTETEVVILTVETLRREAGLDEEK